MAADAAANNWSGMSVNPLSDSKLRRIAFTLLRSVKNPFTHKGKMVKNAVN